MSTNKKIFLEARNLAFKLLYQAKSNKQEVNLSPENMDILIETLTIPDDETDQKSFNHDTIELSKYILNKLITEEEELTKLINTNLHKKNVSQISTTDLSLLLLGTSELNNRNEEEYNFIISSYVDLAKKYGNKESYSLINGVLDSVKRGLSN